MRRGALQAVTAALITVWLAAPAQADEAARRLAQQRLLCVRLSGDLTDPGGMAQFRRCMASRQPLQAIRRNIAPPRRRLNLVSRSVDLTPGSGGALARSTAARCGPGLVWRGATGADHVCVTRQARAAILIDNAHAAARVAGPSGACRQGFVWREATPADHVCVSPATRAEVRAQNAVR